MHLSEIEKARMEKDEKMRNGQDYKAESYDDRMRKGFAQHDGNYSNNVLGARIKVPDSVEPMPRIEGIDDPAKQDKSRNA